MRNDRKHKPDFLDNELEEFIARVWRRPGARGDSLIKLDLLRFLHRNPSSIDSAPNLALRIGRNMDKVEAALEDLMEAGLIVPRGEVWGSMFYSITGEPETQAVVSRFFKICYRSKESILALYDWLDMNSNHALNKS